MAAADNIATVQRAYAAFLRGDLPGVYAELADTVTWKVHGPGEIVPMFRRREGKSDIPSFFEQMGQSITFNRFEPVSYYADERTVITRLLFEVTFKRSGETLNYDTIHVWDFVGDKIAAFNEYFDTHAYVQAWQR
jgi:ketosteroid isomerase-like protein